MKPSILLFVTALLLSTSSAAHDGLHDKWFESLKQPNGYSCCNLTDCRATEAEIRNGHWWAREWYTSTWLEVPDKVVIYDKGNPVGLPVLCAIPNYDGGYNVLCFVPGALF